MNPIVKAAVKAFRPENTFFAIRDVTLPTNEIVATMHQNALSKLSKTKFNASFLYMREDGMTVFYKNIKDYQNFSKAIAERCVNKKGYAQSLAKNLIDVTDWLNNFIRANNSIEKLVKQKDLFFEKYLEFFAFHQAVAYSGEYLAKEFHDVSKEDVKILTDAYQYNEKLVPAIEVYFKSLGINHKLISEFGINKANQEKDRSILYLKDKIRVLDSTVAKLIHEEIQKKYDAYVQNKTSIIGITACKGKVQGIARVITHLEEQNNCKEGDIVILPQTRPQYNHILMKVKAIVTDEGGKLAHAAILAREYNIPCIVGTTNATRLINTGDEVLVNADDGTVTIIKKAKK